jgi:hypothetical protein
MTSRLRPRHCRRISHTRFRSRTDVTVLGNVIAAVEQLKSAWVNVNNAISRDFENHTAQALGWQFGILQTPLDTCRDFVERYLQVVSDLNKRTLLRRWYKRHWRLTQWLLDLRVHRVSDHQGSQ